MKTPSSFQLTQGEGLALCYMKCFKLMSCDTTSQFQHFVVLKCFCYSNILCHLAFFSQEKEVLYSVYSFRHQPSWRMGQLGTLCLSRDPSDFIKSSQQILINNHKIIVQYMSYVLIVFPFQSNLDKLGRFLFPLLVQYNFASMCYLHILLEVEYYTKSLILLIVTIKNTYFSKVITQ